MNTALITQLKIIRLTNLKPNFSELSRQYNCDRRTVKKYYYGYEGKPAHRSKRSRLDRHISIIRQKLGIKGIKIRSVYEFLISEVDANIGSYSNFLKQIQGVRHYRYNK